MKCVNRGMSDADQTLSILVNTGDCMTPMMIGKKMKPRMYAAGVEKILWRNWRSWPVEFRFSGCGTRWWAV